MDNITLTEADSEAWQFTLYASTDGKLFGDFVYSPRSGVDVSMLIALTHDEMLAVKDNRDTLLVLAESIRNDYERYLPRSLSREGFDIT